MGRSQSPMDPAWVSISTGSLVDDAHALYRSLGREHRNDGAYLLHCIQPDAAFGMPRW